MKVWILPNYSISEDFIPDYAEDVKKVSNRLELLHHMIRWGEVLTFGTFPSVEDTDEALICLEKLKTTGYCHEKCLGMEIKAPFNLIRTVGISKHFQCPEFTALHQAFCKSDTHEHCFNGAAVPCDKGKLTRQAIMAAATRDALSRKGTLGVSLMKIIELIHVETYDDIRVTAIDLAHNLSAIDEVFSLLKQRNVIV